MIIMELLFNKPDFNILHVTILGTNNCGKTRRAAFEHRHIFMDGKSRCDYAEHILFQYCNKIISLQMQRNQKF